MYEDLKQSIKLMTDRIDEPQKADSNHKDDLEESNPFFPEGVKINAEEDIRQLDMQNKKTSDDDVDS